MHGREGGNCSEGGELREMSSPPLFQFPARTGWRYVQRSEKPAPVPPTCPLMVVHMSQTTLRPRLAFFGWRVWKSSERMGKELLSAQASGACLEGAGWGRALFCSTNRTPARGLACSLLVLTLGLFTLTQRFQRSWLVR